MKRKSTQYNTADGGGWMHVCDELFLAKFRGKPCIICGKTHAFDGRKTVRSCGHHLHHKSNCRKFRYDERNIVGSLCVQHHSKWAQDVSPHSEVNELAVKRFCKLIEETRPEQYKWWKETELEARKPFDKSWTYREMYKLLGGEIDRHSKPMLVWDKKKKKNVTRRVKQDTIQPMKYWIPKNHKKNVTKREAEDDNTTE